MEADSGGEAVANPSKLTDEELMSVLSGEPETESVDEIFSEMFRRYETRVRGWCGRITGDHTRAIDLTQEVFFKAYRHLRSYRGNSRFSTWLYAITRNHCLNSLKQRASEPVEITDLMALRLRDTKGMDVFRTIENGESFRKVWQVVAATLNATEVHVLMLHYAHEVPLGVITRQLTLTNPSGAKAYIVNARRKLKRALRHRSLIAGETVHPHSRKPN